MKNLILIFLCSLVFSCQTECTDSMDATDTLAIRLAVIELKYGQKIDSLEKNIADLQSWTYQIEKEQRTESYYLRKDFNQIKHLADSMGRKDPKNGKVWFAIGKVAGGIIKGIVPGL